MVAKSDCIITSIYLTKDMCEEIDKKADREHVSRTEQIRRYIEKGLSIDGYRQDIDFIASILCQEIMAVYYPEDITARVEDSFTNLLEKQVSRIEKMQMKIGKVSAAGYFLLIKVLLDMAGKDDPLAFSAMVEQAGQMGIEFMKQKNSTVNEILQDGIYACRTVDEPLS